MNSFLFEPLSHLSQIKPHQRLWFARLAQEDYVKNLLMVLPQGLCERTLLTYPRQDMVGKLVSLPFFVTHHHKVFKSPHYIFGHCGDEKIPLVIILFNSYAKYTHKMAPENTWIGISGRLLYKRFKQYDCYQMVHPEFMGPVKELPKWEGVSPEYPLSGQLTQSVVKNVIHSIVNKVEDISEWIPDGICQQWCLPPFTTALRKAHQPTHVSHLSPLDPHRKRLGFDELYARQVAHYFHYIHQARVMPAVIHRNASILQQFYNNLPFTLTKDQQKAIQEIITDLGSDQGMHRLLQGDVGSGKTLVAIAAALVVISQGYQVAFLAPTDILVRQHLKTVEKLAAMQAFPFQFCVLTGREQGKKRQEILKKIENNTYQLVIGTHAIFQPTVHYHSLMLSIVDEQHRFGVKQRAALTMRQNSQGVHVLSMTATPIPRTLQLAHYAEMSVSKIKEKPPLRQSVDTRVMSANRLSDVIEFITKRLLNDEKIFWVCPLIEESDKSTLMAAEERYKELCDIFGDKVALTHGKQSAEEKEQSFLRFTDGDARILVATTVIEVGVDVPEATVMIIEHAERFGLAQLHQLRGRIGRGTLTGTCLLLYYILTPMAKKRLEMMKKTDDGFEIAEADLRLRGGGDLQGLKQSGVPDFKFAALHHEDPDVCDIYHDIFLKADEAAKDLLHQDPHLLSDKGVTAQFMMRFFNTQETAGLKQTG